MKILAIETSCDETAAAVVKDGWTILSSVVASQIPIHEKFHGVVPELASRAHVENINAVVNRALQKAGNRPDAVAVTVGPGLVGSLLVGRMTAETLAWTWDCPLIPVNHLEGHLLSPLLENPRAQPPFLGLIVSGGHTDLVLARGWGDYRIIGRTRDDAAGEAFDKVAKLLDLPYPGGPSVEKAARHGREGRQPFPVPWLESTWDFSFSGLKTAVRYRLRERRRWRSKGIQDICLGFQNSVIQVLVEKTIAAARHFKLKTIVVGGGVAANSTLRRRFAKHADKSMRILFAPPVLCTDNAAMIGAAAFHKLRKHRTGWTRLHVDGRLHFPIQHTSSGFIRHRPRNSSHNRSSN